MKDYIVRMLAKDAPIKAMAIQGRGLVQRAREILEELEAGSLPLSPPPGESSGDAPQGQVSLMDVGGQRVLERLRRIDVNTLTPIEALNVLFELKKCVE